MRKTTLLTPQNGLAVSVVGVLIGYIFSNSVEFGLCLSEEYNCRDLLNRIGDPLLYGMGALAIVFAVLLFLPNAFSAWKKFAIWFVPAAAVLFIFYSDPGSGDLFSPYAEQVHMVVAKLYVGISLLIIGVSHFRTKGVKKRGK